MYVYSTTTAAWMTDRLAFKIYGILYLISCHVLRINDSSVLKPMVRCAICTIYWSLFSTCRLCLPIKGENPEVERESDYEVECGESHEERWQADHGHRFGPLGLGAARDPGGFACPAFGVLLCGVGRRWWSQLLAVSDLVKYCFNYVCKESGFINNEWHRPLGTVAE